MKYLRWIAVLPGSMLAYLLGRLIGFLNGFLFSWFNGFIDIINVFMSYIFAGYAYLYIGCLIAPKFKNGTAITLAILLAIFTTFYIILEINQNGANKTVYGCIISIISCIVACVQVCNNEILDDD